MNTSTQNEYIMTNSHLYASIGNNMNLTFTVDDHSKKKRNSSSITGEKKKRVFQQSSYLSGCTYHDCSYTLYRTRANGKNLRTRRTSGWFQQLWIAQIEKDLVQLKIKVKQNTKMKQGQCTYSRKHLILSLLCLCSVFIFIFFPVAMLVWSKKENSKLMMQHTKLLCRWKY